MKFSTVITALACTEVALGARWTQKRRESRLARRAGGSTRSTQPMQKVDASTVQLAGLVATNKSNVEYSSNWAGAVISTTGITEVVGTVTVPTPSSGSSSGNTEYAGSAWVGIDGDTCQTAILQTGIDWYVQGSSISYDAWYEWYPDYAYNFGGITISAGDSIRMTVTATSTSTGSAVVENLTTGTTVTQTFTAADTAGGSLCEYDAEWIVEDFSQCTSSGSCSLVPFADFGTVTFTEPSAVRSGAAVYPSAATIIDIEQNNQVLTDCSASASEVSCTYTG